MLPVFRGDFFPSFDVENFRQDFLGRIFGEEFFGKNFWGRIFGEKFLGKNFWGRISGEEFWYYIGKNFESQSFRNRGKCCPFFFFFLFFFSIYL